MKRYSTFFFIGLFVITYASEDPFQLINTGNTQLNARKFHEVRNTIDQLKKVANNTKNAPGVRSVAQRYAVFLEQKLLGAERESSSTPPQQVVPSTPEQPQVVPVIETPISPVPVAAPSLPVTQPQQPQVIPPVVEPSVAPTEKLPPVVIPISKPQAAPSRPYIEPIPSSSRVPAPSEKREYLCKKEKDKDMSLTFYLSLKNDTVSEKIKHPDPIASSAPLLGQYAANYNFALPLIFIENNNDALQYIPKSMKNTLEKLHVSITSVTFDFFTIVWGPLEEQSSSRIYNLVFHPVVREWVKSEKGINISNFNKNIKMGIFDPQGVKARSIALNNASEQSVSIHPANHGITAFSPDNAQIEIEAV